MFLKFQKHLISKPFHVHELVVFLLCKITKKYIVKVIFMRECCSHMYILLKQIDFVKWTICDCFVTKSYIKLPVMIIFVQIFITFLTWRHLCIFFLWSWLIWFLVLFECEWAMFFIILFVRNGNTWIKLKLLFVLKVKSKMTGIHLRKFNFE